MDLVDLFQLTHKYTAFGKAQNNSYHALRANPGETAQDVNDAYADSILPIVRALQTDDYINDELVCFNLGDDEDFHSQSLSSAPGLRAGANSPSFVAAAVRFPTLNRAVHSGQKRFAGLMETDITEGVIIGATIVLVQNIADAMLANWLASADSHHVANYVIIKRVCDEEDPITEKCLQYRLPEDLEIPVFYQPTSSLINAKASSQVSRKTF